MAFLLYPAVKELYQHLYRKATLHSNFNYQTNRRDRLIICKFIKWINGAYKQHQINESLLIQFFEFQFSRYSGIVTPKGKNNILISWLIGPAAIKHWTSRNVKKRYLVTWRINKDFKLHLKQTFTTIKVNRVPAYLLALNEYEEESKKRFHNKPEGYLYCKQMTTLYNPFSELCRDCDFKDDCIDRLKINFEELYKIRIHDN